MKTFATILFAVCVCSRLALSAEWNDLNADVIDAIGNKLDANDKFKFSVTSLTVMKNVKVLPQEILEHAVNSNNFLWDQVEMLLKVKKSDTSLDAFVVKKRNPRNAGFVPDLTESVKDELTQWTDAFLSATKNEDERRKIFDKRMLFINENKNVSYGAHVNIYAVWEKYSLSEIATCINDAHDKLVKECFVNGKIAGRCAVYYFACGFQLHNHRDFHWVVGQSKIFLERDEVQV